MKEKSIRSFENSFCVSLISSGIRAYSKEFGEIVEWCDEFCKGDFDTCPGIHTEGQRGG